MKVLKEAKRRYDQIPIPDRLHTMVLETLQSTGRPYIPAMEKSFLLKKRPRPARYIAAAAAMFFLLFTTALNTSPVFAQEAGELPVIGGIVRLLTFRSFSQEQDGIGIDVNIPSIEGIAEDTGTSDAVNEEIYRLCSQYAEEAMQRALDYRQAFLDTGGTLEQWEAHHVRIQVDYEIQSQTKQHLSFVVRGTESWSNAYRETRYYTLDAQTGEAITLSDVLGEDYAALVNQSIRTQIAQREESGEIDFWEISEGGFDGISGDTQFYLNDAENPVIVFEPYKIAPGSYGEIEFEIRSEK